MSMQTKFVEGHVNFGRLKIFTSGPYEKASPNSTLFPKHKIDPNDWYEYSQFAP